MENAAKQTLMRQIFFNKRTQPYLLLLPVFLYYLVFWATPVLTGLKEFLTDYSGAFSPTFSFKLLLRNDANFLPAVKNSALFAVSAVIIQYILALFCAILLNRKFTGSKLMMFLIIVPMAAPATVTAILWKTGLVNSGWLNYFLIHIGLIKEPIMFLSQKGINGVLLLVLMDTWTVMPSLMIILIAGLQNINKEFKEAAFVIGANKWQILKDITIPLLKPAIITSIILRMIGAVQVWAIAVMVMGFGTVPFLVERIAYFHQVAYSYEYAKKVSFAYSFFTTFIVLTATFAYFKFAKRKTAFDGGVR